MRRTLALRKESLADLGVADLTAVVAGADTTFNCPSGFTVCGLCEIEIMVPPLPTEHRSGC